MADVVAEIGVLTGAGLCALLEDARTVQVDPPSGETSAPAAVGAVQGRSVTVRPPHAGHCVDGPRADPALL